MTIKMIIMFIIDGRVTAFGSLCNLGLGEDRNHRCDMLSCCSWSKFVSLQQKPYEGNYYQSVNFTDSKFWGRGLRGEKKEHVCL